jgi:hypothetical protein
MSRSTPTRPGEQQREEDDALDQRLRMPEESASQTGKDNTKISCECIGALFHRFSGH